MVTRILLLSGLLLALNSFGQVGAPRKHVLASYTLLTGSSTTAGATNSPTYRGRGFGLTVHGATTNDASPATLTVNLEFTLDGSNYTTHTPLTWTVPLVNTTNFYRWTNISAAAVDNIQRVKLLSIVNGHTNSVHLTNISLWVQP